ncbi:hypothetical protein MHK_003074 [Candidatus Magnetomorum sp. HK-1]|nr:hypothetical protein MHK_003074 [Candidatus Magnetomorum sp. HK-1]
MSINVNTLAANFDAGVSNYALHELKEISTALKPLKSAKHQQIFQPEASVSVRLKYLAQQLNVLNGGRPSKILVDYVYQTINPEKESLVVKKKKNRPQSQKAIKIFNRYRQLAENDARESGLTGDDFEYYVIAGASAKSGDTVARLFNRNYQHTYEAFKQQTEEFFAERRSFFLYQASELLGAELRLFISLVAKAPEMLEIIIQIMQSLDENTRLIFLQETVRQQRVHLIPFLKIAEDAIQEKYLDHLFTIMAALNDENLSYFLSAITKSPDASVMIHMMQFMETLSDKEISQFLFLAQIPTKDDFYLLFNAFETMTDSNSRSRAFETACELPEKDTFNYMKALAHSEKNRNQVMNSLDQMKSSDNKSNYLFLAAWHSKYLEEVNGYLESMTSESRIASFLRLAVNADHLLPDFLKIYSSLLSDELTAFFVAAEKNIDSLFEFLSQVQEKKGYERAMFLSEASK